MIYTPKYFDLKELVCKHVYYKFNQMAWQFFDEKALLMIDWVRETLNKPMYINDWDINGTFTQRGLRCIQCDIVKSNCTKGVVYVSPHMLGKGFDFDIKGMTAEEVRTWLISKQDQLPYNIRLEKNVTWVHMDTEDTGQKIFLFNP